MNITQLNKDDKKFYNSLVRTVGKDSLHDIARHGAGGGYPGITYVWDCEKFVKNNRQYIRELIQQDIQDGILVRSDYYLFRNKLTDIAIIEIDSFIFLNKWNKNIAFDAISWICWYSIESFVFRIIDWQWQRPSFARFRSWSIRPKFKLRTKQNEKTHKKIRNRKYVN